MAIIFSNKLAFKIGILSFTIIVLTQCSIRDKITDYTISIDDDVDSIDIAWKEIKLYDLLSLNHYNDLINNGYELTGELTIEIKNRKRISSVKKIRNKDLDKIKKNIYYYTHSEIGYLYCSDTSGVFNEEYEYLYSSKLLYIVTLKKQ